MDMTVTGLLQAYRDHSLTPDAVMDYVLAQADRYASHNIWIQRLSRSQIQPYLDALAAHSPDTLPLYGIPFAIKDNIDLAGVPTTAGCEAYRYTPQHSAFVVEQLIQAGAIPVGKTNLDQFATGLVGTRSPFGACKNAFNTDYISGGSSSGSAVAVALGLVSFSLGTDTAGSGRVPAAFNNIVGVKPSKGLVSTRGVVPACRSLDCVSLFALTTDDANHVLDIMVDYDAEDDYARPNSFSNNARHYGVINRPFRFGVPREDQLEFFGNDNAHALFNKTVEKICELGGTKIEVDFSPFRDAARLLYDGPWVAERYTVVEKLLAQKPDVLLPVIRRIICSAESKSAVDAFRAHYQLQHDHQQAENILARVDFMLTPTTGTIYTIDQVNREPVALNSNLGYYTNYMNLLDCAAVAVPAGFMRNGLPFGVTLVADHHTDRKLLSFANVLQQALQLPLGALKQSLQASTLSEQTPAFSYSNSTALPVVVCGAHLDGLPLNWQLRERGAMLSEKTVTSSAYRMYALAGGPPFRPGLVRDTQNGCAIEIEVWQVPAENFGSFVAMIPAPLGIGKVELADGRWLPGFICEPCGMANAQDISHLGSWRAYLAQQK